MHMESRLNPTCSGSSGLTRASRLLEEGAIEEAKQLLFELYATEEFSDGIDIIRARLCIERALGDCFAAENHLDESFEWYRRAYWNDRTHVNTLYSLAVVEQKRKSYVTAVQYCTEILQLNPQHLAALTLRGQLQLSTGALVQAAQDINILKPLDSLGSPALDENLTRPPTESINRESTVGCGDREVKARQLMHQSRYCDVVRLLNSGNRSAEESLMLASAWIRQANYATAKRCLLELLHGNVRASKANIHVGISLLAHVYERTCEYDQALKEVKKVDDDSKMGSHLAHVVEGQCLEAHDDYVGAATVYRLVCEAVAHPLAFVRLGYVRLQQRNFQEAKSLLLQVEELPFAESCFTDTIGFANRKTVRGVAFVYRGIVSHQSGEGSSANLFLKATEFHDNFRCVLESVHASDIPTAATALRGICDLDLSAEETVLVISLLRGLTPSRAAAPFSLASSPLPRSNDAVTLGPMKSPRDVSAGNVSASNHDAIPTVSISDRVRTVPAVQAGTRPSGETPSHSQDLWLFSNVNLGLTAPSLQLAPAVKASFNVAPFKLSSTGIHASASMPFSRTLAPPVMAFSLPSSSPSTPRGADYLSSQEIFVRSDVVLGAFLGEGSFGTVYTAHVRGKLCACKMIHKRSSIAEAEFLKEVDSFKHLAHPRLVKFYGVVMENEHSRSLAGMLTEYMQNGNLYSMLFGSNPAPRAVAKSMPGQVRLRLAVEVGEGLDFLHAHRPPVVHRDMKSMNVLLDGGLHAKLCDFGLTQPLEVGKTHLSRCSEEKGSPRYMAPEYYDERMSLTEKVDIWGYGCTLVEIYGGTVPYCACSTLQQLCAKIMVAKVAPDIPQCDNRIRKIIEACFVFDPHMRISAAEICCHLR